MTRKPTWLTEAEWRALRTAAQTLAGSIIVALASVLTAYAQPPHIFDWDTLYYGGFITGIAALLALRMNR